MKFDYQTPTLDTSWRSIILLGQNTASYKFALAKTLLELNIDNDLVLLDDFALPYARNIARHLAIEDKQATSPTSKFLDACREFNLGEITEEQLREETIKEGFKYVIDAFHMVATSEVPFRFFEDLRKEKKAIKLTDNFYKLLESDQADNFLFEVDSRWRLWETAISQNINPGLLSIEHDNSSQILYGLDKQRQRINITSARDALNGYQKGRCFYCSRSILIEGGSALSCHVDHFFPHFLVQHDGFRDINNIWNLVLSCERCNLQKSNKISKIEFLEKLEIRNNFYIQSHHPLRETIIKQTGKTAADRENFLRTYMHEASGIMPRRDWEPEEYFGDHNTLLTI